MSRLFDFLVLVVYFGSFLAPVSLVVASSASYAAWEDVSWAIWDVKLSSLLGEDKQKLYDDHIARCREVAGDTDRADAHCYVDEYVSAILVKKQSTNKHCSLLNLEPSFPFCYHSTACN
eukprot:scaffold2413_cov171-Amphora_coffeaeformis.AAC.5